MSMPARLLAVVCLALVVMAAGASLVIEDSQASSPGLTLAILPGQTPVAPFAPQVEYEFVEGSQYTTNDCASSRNLGELT